MNASTPEWQNEMTEIAKLNKRCAIWHFTLATACLTSSFVYEDSKTLTVPVTSQIPSWDAGYPVVVKERLGEFNLIRAASLFSYLAAIDHAACLWWRDHYEAQLRRSCNRYRWYEYSVSSSLILVLLYMSWGNFDFGTLGGCFVLNWCMIMFGDLMEQLNKGKVMKDVKWTPFFYGWLCGLVPWVVKWTRIFNDVNREYFPWYAWWWVIGYQFFFFTFPFNMLMYYWQVGRWDNSKYKGVENGGFLHAEKVYCYMSLSIKTILLLLCAGAVVDPNVQVYKTVGADY